MDTEATVIPTILNHLHSSSILIINSLLTTAPAVTVVAHRHLHMEPSLVRITGRGRVATAMPAVVAITKKPVIFITRTARCRFCFLQYLISQDFLHLPRLPIIPSIFLYPRSTTLNSTHTSLICTVSALNILYVLLCPETLASYAAVYLFQQQHSFTSLAYFKPRYTIVIAPRKLSKYLAIIN
jgi:hypothetical protein